MTLCQRGLQAYIQNCSLSELYHTLPEILFTEIRQTFKTAQNGMATLVSEKTLDPEAV